MKLFCAVVGETGNAFPMTIEASESVGDLKDAIKAKKNKIKCDADELQLFLARKGDVTWLDGRAAGPLALRFSNDGAKETRDQRRCGS
jgi:hypothetical protein